MNYKSLIREVPDFPKPGILFYDITPLLKDATTFQCIIDELVDLYQGQQPLACRLQAGFVPVRKPGKLPADVFEVKYNLEYGSNSLAIHRDAIEMGEKVLVVDDLLATGGTAAATVKLINQLGGEIVGCAFLMELLNLSGREKLTGIPLQSLMSYP